MEVPPCDLPPPVAQPLSPHEAALAISTDSVLFNNSEVPAMDAPVDRSTHLPGKEAKAAALRAPLVC